MARPGDVVLIITFCGCHDVRPSTLGAPCPIVALASSSSHHGAKGCGSPVADSFQFARSYKSEEKASPNPQIRGNPRLKSPGLWMARPMGGSYHGIGGAKDVFQRIPVPNRWWFDTYPQLWRKVGAKSSNSWKPPFEILTFVDLCGSAGQPVGNPERSRHIDASGRFPPDDFRRTLSGGPFPPAAPSVRRPPYRSAAGVMRTLCPSSTGRLTLHTRRSLVRLPQRRQWV